MRYILLMAVLILSASVVRAETPENFYNKPVESFMYKDGCVVSNAIDDPKVLNPKECPDKELVAFLNCNDQFIRPVEERSEECRDAKPSQPVAQSESQ